jgi:type I restriction enzyme M protein
MSEFGSQLRTARKEHRLSQAALGTSVGVSQVQISLWETGKSTPSGAQLQQLRAKLGDFTKASLSLFAAPPSPPTPEPMPTPPPAAKPTPPRSQAPATPTAPALAVPMPSQFAAITGELKTKVDKVWEAFWSGGISNPMSVMEQISYLLFIKRLDDIHTAAEKKANRLGRPIDNPVFGPKQRGLRWSNFKQLSDATALLTVVREKVFPFIKTLGAGEESSYAKHMKDAVFLITNAGMLKSVIDQLDAIPMKKRDTKGDLYEYMLSKIASAGQNGQFRTPRHIIQMMVRLTAPKPSDIICDPACGTAGFLVEAGEYLRLAHPKMLHDAVQKAHFNNAMFHGYDFDATMLRIGSMNMMLHGIEDPDIISQDSLADTHASLADAYTLVLANPPFKGAIDYGAAAKNLLAVAKTKKTELLFVALILRLLKLGGRAAVIVPDGVLFGSSKAHKAIRQALVESHKLEGVISMPSGVFKPYAGVSTAILLFTKTGAGGTDKVWFYGMKADGYSLDDKRDPVEANDIPDILAKWQKKNPAVPGKRTEKAFFVPKKEIKDNGYDLSINRYKEIVYEEVKYDPPKVIIGKLRKLEAEIRVDLDALEGMLG